MEYTVAELFDKITILRVKEEIAPDERTRETLRYQMEEVKKHIHLGKSVHIDHIVEDLYKVNKKIFEAIRFIQTSDDLLQVGLVAKECQALNLDRSRFKKAIDSLLHVEERDLEIKL